MSDILSCAKRFRRGLTYKGKSINLQSKRKETPAKVSMKNYLSKKKKNLLSVVLVSFASSENLKEVTVFKRLIREGP